MNRVVLELVYLREDCAHEEHCGSDDRMLEVGSWEEKGHELEEEELPRKHINNQLNTTSGT